MGHNLCDCHSKQGQCGSNSRAQYKTLATTASRLTQQGNSSDTSDDQRQNNLYALQGHQDKVDSTDVFTGTL